MIANKALAQLGLIAPNRAEQDVLDQEILRERQYNFVELRIFVQTNVPKLNDQQKFVYNTIMQGVINQSGGLFFLDAPGGTGKTFLV